MRRIARGEAKLPGEDVVVLALGEPTSYTGERRGRARITLPEAELENLRTLKRGGKKIVSVVFAGRPVILDEVAWLSDAVVMAWYPGAMGAEALAEILCGETNPSGKLAQHIPLDVGQIPLSYREKRTFISCAYADIPAKPLYPFGYGLSYTTFSYGKPVDLGNEGGMRRISCEVTNTGTRRGREVVQLYLRDEKASVLPRERELREFTSVTLDPGETRRVVFALPQDAFAIYDADLKRVVELGEFTVFVGGDSSTENGAVVKLP
jgi:beta-glucosidase